MKLQPIERKLLLVFSTAFVVLFLLGVSPFLSVTMGQTGVPTDPGGGGGGEGQYNCQPAATPLARCSSPCQNVTINGEETSYEIYPKDHEVCVWNGDEKWGCIMDETSTQKCEEKFIFEGHHCTGALLSEEDITAPECYSEYYW